MSETLTVVGQLQGITEKPSGWTTVEVAVPGKNWPLKLDTKRSELIETARATKGAIATWTYKETEAEKTNPNTGKPYLNRYLENVEEGAAVPAGGGSDAPEPHHEPIHFADKDRAISRMACIKAAASMPGPESPPSDYDWALEVMKAAHRFEQWVYRDIDAVPFE